MVLKCWIKKILYPKVYWSYVESVVRICKNICYQCLMEKSQPDKNLCVLWQKYMLLHKKIFKIRERAREKKERLDRSLKNIDFILENFSPKLKEKIQRAWTRSQSSQKVTLYLSMKKYRVFSIENPSLLC